MDTIKKGFSFVVQDIIQKPKESPNASMLLVKANWILRTSLFSFGLIEIFRGQILLGFMIMLCVLILLAPSFFTLSHINDIPVEIEFFLFIIVFFQYVVGEAGGFYRKISFYDNITHFLFPFLIGIIGFTIVYSLYSAKKLNVSVKTMVLFVVLITLGIGALWEILEFLLDQFIVPHFDNLHRAQGSSPANANMDSMTDLIFDLLGGIVGSLVAARYILEAKYNKRLNELLKEIISNFFRKKSKK